MLFRTAFMLLFAAGLGLVPAAAARIKLSTLPDRERVEIQLDHGQATLVEEERLVPLLKGTNLVDFAWSNTRIDKDSIQFRPIAVRRGGAFRPPAAGEVNVINVAYPPNETALVWEVWAKDACALKVRVSYLIGELTRSFSYRALADKDETKLVLKNYIRLRNYSGEGFEDAGVWAGFGPRFERRVDAQTDLKMLLHRFAEVPIRKSFTFDWYTHGPLNPDKPHASRVLTHYELVNGAGHGLGRFPLQPGKVRIFIQDGRGGEAFLGEDWAGLTPIDGRLRLYLGEARDIVCTRTIRTNRRLPVRGNLFHQEVVVRYEIENFRSTAATLAIVEQLNRLAREFGADPKGDVEWERLGAEPLRLTFEHGHAVPVLVVDLPARPAEGKVEKQVVEFHVLLKNLWS